ncbi:MAG: hypothetical protein ABJO27_27080 [Pseudoruegeria sp.]
MSGALEPPEFLDVQMQELARVLALIATHRRLGIKAGETAKTKAGQPSGNRRAGKVQLLADLRPGQPMVPA